MALMSQADYSRLHGVSRKTVTQWKDAGYLTMVDGKVDADASDETLSGRRLGRFKGSVTAPVTAGNRTETVTPEPDLEEIERDADAFIRRVLSGDYASLAEAERIKENALAVKNLLAVRKQAGALVEFEVAEAVLFGAARAARDAWINWPARVGPMVAADLGVEADKATEVLTAHVHEQLAQIGEPEADFGSED